MSLSHKQTPKGDVMTYRGEIEWCDFWIEHAQSETKPRVLLIGDSITRSYFSTVSDQLNETYACARLASSKCVADPSFFLELKLVLSEYCFAAIHFNNGLHGWDYDEDAYSTGLAQALDVLIDHCNADNVIWGHTTPVFEKEKEGVLKDITDRVRARNAIAETLTSERGISINDLFSAAVTRPNLFGSDGVHFHEQGQSFLGTQMADAIKTRICDD